MNNFSAIINKFNSKLPLVKTWIYDLLDSNNNNAISVSTLNLPTIKRIFPIDFLDKSKVVYVMNKVPFPPLSSFGLPELSQMEPPGSFLSL